MTEIFALIVLILSFFGMLLIFLKKLPILVSLSPNTQDSQENLLLKLKNKTLEIRFLKFFSSEIFLQKILSKIRVLTLKTENKTSYWLQQLRKSARKKKEIENDNYWKELKNSASQGSKDSPRNLGESD